MKTTETPFGYSVQTGALRNTGTKVNKDVRPLTSEDIKLTHKIIMFMFNYDHAFLLKAMKDTGLAGHFQLKFDSYYTTKGSGERAFLYLWTDMTSNHRVTLANYINLNFKG